MLDKAIEKGKEHRKPYRGAKAVSLHCRNHGGCLWCEGNRLNKYRAKVARMKQEEKELKYKNIKCQTNT